MNLPSTDALLLLFWFLLYSSCSTHRCCLLFVHSVAFLLTSGNINELLSVGRSKKERKKPNAGDTAVDVYLFMMVALGIWYVMGSSFPLSLASIGRSSWKGIIVLEEWVREVVVPCYTLSALLYLLLRNHNDSKEGTTSSSSFGSSLSSSLRKLPALRMLSSLTASSEEEA